MGGVRWTYEEDLILQTWSDWESRTQLAKRLGRTEKSVASRLKTLGIKKKNVYSPNRTWTQENVDYLSRSAGKVKAKTIAKNLNKSLSSIKKKAEQLGLSLRSKKAPDWTKCEERTLVELVGLGYTWEQISEKIERTPQACRKKSSFLGYTRELKKEWTLRELKELHRARTHGESYVSIAKRFNRTEHSVRKRYARYKKECLIQ